MKNLRNRFLLADLSADKSARACLPPAGALPRQPVSRGQMTQGLSAAPHPLPNGLQPYGQRNRWTLHWKVHQTVSKARAVLLCLGALTPLPAHATDLWCMPDKICAGTNCAIEFDEESSLRLTNPDGPNPSLRSHAETIPMTKTHNADTVQWEGMDDHGEPEILAYLPSTRRFTYLVGRDDDPSYGQYKATGVCEVQ